MCLQTEHDLVRWVVNDSRFAEAKENMLAQAYRIDTVGMLAQACLLR